MARPAFPFASRLRFTSAPQRDRPRSTLYRIADALRGNLAGSIAALRFSGKCCRIRLELMT